MSCKKKMCVRELKLAWFAEEAVKGDIKQKQNKQTWKEGPKTKDRILKV